LTIAIYPGTFDPITNGHLDIVARSSKLFEKLIVGVYDAPNKHPWFTVEERVELVREAIIDFPNVDVMPFHELTVNFARRLKAQAMVRGLRMSADFEREFDMAMMNKRLFPELELVCLMASVEYQFLSSTLLKEAASLGGNIDDLVPTYVATALRKRVQSKM
jgi:pantetheine-phosphate adenylyltransferase